MVGILTVKMYASDIPAHQWHRTTTILIIIIIILIIITIEQSVQIFFKKKKNVHVYIPPSEVIL